MAYPERRAIALKRAEEQRKRIARQSEEQLKRVLAARARGEAKTGLNRLERAKIAKENSWKKKWDKRQEKF
jgi:hypothetical protein